MPETSTLRNWIVGGAAVVIAGGVAYVAISPEDQLPEFDTTERSVTVAVPDLTSPASTPNVTIPAFKKVVSVVVSEPSFAAASAVGASAPAFMAASSVDEVLAPQLPSPADTAVSLPTIELPQSSETALLLLYLRAGEFDKAYGLLGDRLLADRTVKRWAGMLTGVSAYDRSLTAGPSERQLQAEASGLRIIRYQGRDDDQAATQAAMSIDSPMLIVTTLGYVPRQFVDVIRRPNVVGVVLGHRLSADLLLADYAKTATALNRLRSLAQMVTQAPVMLACSWMNIADPDIAWRPNIEWAQAFGDRIDGWDGFAIYNVNQFPWFEFNDLASARRKLGLPDKPVVLYDFIGTRATSVDRAKAIWKYKGPVLLPKIKAQGWAGLILFAENPADVALKADLLRRYAR